MNTSPSAASAPVIFIASDQPDDQYLYRQAFGEACPTAILYFFLHKGELLDALRGEVYPRPSLLLMDWDMTRRKGYAALAALAATPAWQTIPVVILSTSSHPVDEIKCQQLGYELVLPRETRHEQLTEQFRGLVRAFA